MNMDILPDLFRSFPKGIVNRNFEFIADPNPRVNTYFCLADCESVLDVKCKVLSWLSRPAFKSQPCYHLDGINAYLGTHFSTEDIGIIYAYLGNDVNRPLCIRFIESGYDLSVLTEARQHYVV